MVTRHDSQLLVFQDIFFLLLFDEQFRLFSFSDSNTYLDTEIFIISLRFGGLEKTLVLFSPLFTQFYHFVYISRSCRLRWPESLCLKLQI